MSLKRACRWDRYEAWHPSLVLWLKSHKVAPCQVRPSYNIDIEEYRKRAKEFDDMRDWIAEHRYKDATV